MTIDTNAAVAERAAHQANGDNARAENMKALARLATTADSQQRAEHIRGIVATTMAQLSADATAATRASAAEWQEWALGLSDAPAPTVSP